MPTLYENIKTRRKELKMSQEQLAKLTGYSDRTSISKIEAGKVDLSQSKIKLFASALQTTPSQLMGWDDAIQELNRLGYGMEAIAYEMNIPLDKLKTAFDSTAFDCNEPWIVETQEKIVRVAQLLANELRGMNLTVSDTDPQVDAILAKMKRLNAQGLERLDAYAEDLISSGRYDREPPLEAE